MFCFLVRASAEGEERRKKKAKNGGKKYLTNDAGCGRVAVVSKKAVTERKISSISIPSGMRIRKMSDRWKLEILRVVKAGADGYVNTLLSWYFEKNRTNFTKRFLVGIHGCPPL